MILQPYVDSLFLSKLAAGSVGWYAAARKLVGVLVFPVAAVSGSFYPTLCRLYAHDRAGFLATASDGVRVTALLVVPIALGCALFPELGTYIYGRTAFAPAADDLRVMSVFVALVYFSMPIGNCLLAAGRQRAWAFVQSLCVVISIVLDPVLIPWFDRRFANGGLGVCWAAVASETIVVLCGVSLAPRGVINRSVVRSLAIAAASGLTMVIVARLGRNISPFVVAPAAVGAYVATLWFARGIDKDEVAAVVALARRKVSSKARGGTL
jgi:O-antigen/teichoic acid export membrane protein